MEVNKDLLQRYVDDQCSAEEKKYVEEWLSEQDFISGSFDQERIRKELSLSWKVIESYMERNRETKTIPLYKKLTRYAAVACFIIAIFFTGRYSTTDSISIVVEKNTEQQSNLLVYGGNGTYAKIPGEAFDLQFDGQLKLYNGSTSVKTVKVGNTTYTLEPLQTYFLMGNNQKSSLTASFGFEAEDMKGELKGNFGIKIIIA